MVVLVPTIEEAKIEIEAVIWLENEYVGLKIPPKVHSCGWRFTGLVTGQQLTEIIRRSVLVKHTPINQPTATLIHIVLPTADNSLKSPYFYINLS